MYLSITTFNVNGLNAPAKRHRIADWIRKQDLSIYMLPPKDLLQTERYTQIKVKEWKNIFHANGKEKEAGVAILISDKIDFNQGYSKRQRRILNNDKGNNPTRGYNPWWT